MVALGSSLIIYFTCITCVHVLSPLGGLVNIDSSPLQPTDWNRAMGLGSSIKILVQSLYFMTLWTRVLYLGDIMRLLVLGLGTIAWIQGYHFHFYNCRKVSVLGGSWLSSGMGSERILLLLAIFCFPAFPGTRVFPALGEGEVSWISTTPISEMNKCRRPLTNPQVVL